MKEAVSDYECVKITEVFLRKVRAEWLAEDPNFLEAVQTGWELSDRVADFVAWMDKFLGHLSKHQDYLARRVSIIRIARWLKNGEIKIKNGRFVPGIKKNND